MERGIDFLKKQVNNAVMVHKEFVESLKSHAEEAEDERFRALCTAHLPTMLQHQAMLEEYQRSLGEKGGGTVKRFFGRITEAGKDVVDSMRESDFLRLVGDIVMARQCEDTFKTFREAGHTLGDDMLYGIGDTGERDHDRYVHEANRLVQQFFVEQVQGVHVTAR